MWSVKWVPNPGLARISETSDSLRGLSEAVVVMSRVMGERYLSWLVGFEERLTRAGASGLGPVGSSPLR